ncbi:Cyclin-dependent kinase 17, partial [Ataeniobius toweri]|nr:Cyclin-dependent kinase 17 [Ataeniobius toweri]
AVNRPAMEKMKRIKKRLSLTLRPSLTIDESLSELAEQMTIEDGGTKDNEPFMRNGRPPTSHSMHSFLHQYTGSFKKPPLRRPHSVIGGTLGSFMAMPRNGSRLGEPRKHKHNHTNANGRKRVVGEQVVSGSRQEACHDAEISTVLCHIIT